MNEWKAKRREKGYLQKNKNKNKHDNRANLKFLYQNYNIFLSLIYHFFALFLLYIYFIFIIL